jgi:2-C-methyl-D-erythritol 4-phosphate cytidylyltransferase
MIAYALDAFEQAASIRDVVLVVGAHTRASADDLVMNGPWDKVLAIVAGGERRQDSVVAGVRAVPTEAAVVVLHDGARPLVTADLIDRSVALASRVGAAIAAVPVTDTLKQVEDERIVETLPRHGLWAAQTPQTFRADLLHAALGDPRAAAESFTDEAALFELLGLPVAILPGSTTNLKVTHRDDLPIAEALLAARTSAWGGE